MERIKEIMYFPSLRCNLSCSHCGENQDIGREQEMDGGLVIRRIAESALVEKHMAIPVSGGEPFLNETLPAFILGGLRQTGCRFHITSNGYFHERIAALAGSMQDRDKERIHFHISIDGLEETHNRIRRNPDSFQKAVRTLACLAESGIPFSINTVVQPANIEELADFQQYLAQRHPHAEINFIPYEPDIGGGGGTAAESIQIRTQNIFRKKHGLT